MLRQVYSFVVSLLLIALRNVMRVAKPRVRRLLIFLNAEVGMIMLYVCTFFVSFIRTETRCISCEETRGNEREQNTPT